MALIVLTVSSLSFGGGLATLYFAWGMRKTFAELEYHRRTNPFWLGRDRS